MPVSRELLEAAQANDHTAIDMVRIWGYGPTRRVSAARWRPACGCWAAARACSNERRPGVLFKDLSACNAYRDGLASAARVTVPAILVLGERDLMTPAKAGMELAAALPKARVVMLKGAGHMLMSERPDEVLHAVGAFVLAA